jgi:NifU-like protein involved in Fe-S cluster formation
MSQYAMRKGQLKEAELELMALELKIKQQLKDLVILADPLQDPKAIKGQLLAMTAVQIAADHVKHTQILKRIDELKMELGMEG